MNKRELNKILKDLQQYVDSMDTPKEVRKSASYLFLIRMTDRLTELGMNVDLAARASARINTNLPVDFADKHPTEFAELIRLFSKQTFILWKTVLADFDDDIYEEVFLQLASTASLNAE